MFTKAKVVGIALPVCFQQIKKYLVIPYDLVEKSESKGIKNSFLVSSHFRFLIAHFPLRWGIGAVTVPSHTAQAFALKENYQKLLHVFRKEGNTGYDI